MDLIIVAGLQRIGHYEIAAYRTGVALAEALGDERWPVFLPKLWKKRK